MNIVTVIQARTGSTRLPNKVLMPVAGKPILMRMVERVQASRFAGQIVVATTTDPSDNPISDLCVAEDIECFRGHPTDLLDRHYHTGLVYEADAVVKIPSDCPLIDPAIIDKVLEFYLVHDLQYDYVSNLHPATYPDGNDVEVISMKALTEAWSHSTRHFEREHTTPFIWEHRGRFKIGNVMWETHRNYSMSHRWTLDYPEDYEFIRSVYEELYFKIPIFNLYHILMLLDSRPDIAAINHKYVGVNWYRHHMNELKTIDASQTKLVL
jgi:spore coat polysaccharide biosynthesis protein SpsF